MDRLGRNPRANLFFYRNDPVLVGGSYTGMKPDVGGMRDQSLEVSERPSVDNLMKDGLDGVCFWRT